MKKEVETGNCLMGVALLTIRTAWCKNGALFRYSVNAGSVPNCLLWQIPSSLSLSLSAVTEGNGIFFSFSCVGGRDQSMWCCVSLIKMTWLFCHAMVSQRGGWESKYLILFRLVLPLCGVGLSWALMRVRIWQLCMQADANLFLCVPLCVCL